jgi:hypothetical protein
MIMLTNIGRLYIYILNIFEFLSKIELNLFKRIKCKFALFKLKLKKKIFKINFNISID